MSETVTIPIGKQVIEWIFEERDGVVGVRQKENHREQQTVKLTRIFYWNKRTGEVNRYHTKK